MNIGNVLSTAIGVVGLGLVGYDSHVAGKIESDAYQKKTTSDVLADSYVNSMSMDRASVVQSKTKKAWHNFKLDDTFFPTVRGIRGYIRGFGGMIVDNVVPFALATCAVLTKGKFAKVSAAGLAAWAAFSFVTDIIGVGKTKKLGSNF